MYEVYKRTNVQSSFSKIDWFICSFNIPGYFLVSIHFFFSTRKINLFMNEFTYSLTLVIEMIWPVQSEQIYKFNVQKCKCGIRVIHTWRFCNFFKRQFCKHRMIFDRMPARSGKIVPKTMHKVIKFTWRLCFVLINFIIEFIKHFYCLWVSILMHKIIEIFFAFAVRCARMVLHRARTIHTFLP